MVAGRQRDNQRDSTDGQPTINSTTNPAMNNKSIVINVLINKRNRLV